MPKWPETAIRWTVDHWKSLGISAAAVTVGGVMKWWYSIRKVRAEALKAEAELKELRTTTEQGKFEIDVAEMMRKIRKIKNEQEAAHLGLTIETKIDPSPEDNIEVFNEAMKRLREQRPGSGSVRRGRFDH